MRYILFLFIFILLFESCVHSQQNANIRNGRLIYEGVINSNIPAFMYLKIEDSIVVGEIKYLKTRFKQAIKIIGYVDEDGSIKLNEFSKSDTISGIFFGQLNNDTFAGTWVSPNTKKSLDFKFLRKDTLINNVEIHLGSSSTIGTYGYVYGKQGAVGNLTVSGNCKSVMTFKFSNYSDAPEKNSAEFKISGKLSAKKDIIFRFEESCIFRIRFKGDFIIVTYVNNQRDCGFGNGAYIDGIYRKKH